MALYTLRTGATAHPEDSVLQHLTDQINSSGVFDFAGNDFKVQAQATPDLTVKVIKGRAYIKAISGNSYPIRADADSNVSIGSNSSGNPRIDALVLFIDLSAAPNSDASNVAKLQVVQGTPAPSPSIPSDPVIQAEIGASNPFIRLANISVASGATSIVNANIVDTRVVVGFKVGKVELKEGRVGLLEQATPATPASGSMLVYPKTDNKLYKLDDAGIETEVGAGASEFMPNLLDNGNFINNSDGGYGANKSENWTNVNANPNQGGFPTFTKQDLIDILGITNSQVKAFWNLNGNFNDLSDSGYNLTPTVSPTDDTQSLMAQSKKFLRSSSQYATRLSATNLNMNTKQTWFCFFRLASGALGNSHTLMGRRSSGGTGTVAMYIGANSHSLALVMNGLSFNPTMQQRVEENCWNLALFSYDPANNYFALFVNGVQYEVGGVTGTLDTSQSTFSLGRAGDFNGDYFDGFMQCAGVLSTNIDHSQMNKLWAFTTYRGMKIRRSGSNGHMLQDLSNDIFEKHRGKKLTLAVKYYQDTASIASISIDDGVTETESTPSATVGSFVQDSISKVISSAALYIRIRIKVSNSNGTAWFREVTINESDSLVKYTHSPQDWTRFPSLLRCRPPRDGQGIYHFEENRDYPFTVTPSDVSWSNPSTTYTSLSDYGSSYRFLSRDLIQWKPRVLFQGFNSALSYILFIEGWVSGNLVESGIPAPGVVHFYGTPGPGPGSYHLGMATIGDTRHTIQKYDGGNITSLGGFFYAGVNWIFTIVGS